MLLLHLFVKRPDFWFRHFFNKCRKKTHIYSLYTKQWKLTLTQHLWYILLSNQVVSSSVLFHLEIKKLEFYFAELCLHIEYLAWIPMHLQIHKISRNRYSNFSLLLNAFLMKDGSQCSHRSQYQVYQQVEILDNFLAHFTSHDFMKISHFTAWHKNNIPPIYGVYTSCTVNFHTVLCLFGTHMLVNGQAFRHWQTWFI